MGNVKIYESREFCKDINCEIQRNILRSKTIYELQGYKKHCKEKCKAWYFHKWLYGNGYVIIKSKEEVPIIKNPVEQLVSMAVRHQEKSKRQIQDMKFWRLIALICFGLVVVLMYKIFTIIY